MKSTTNKSNELHLKKVMLNQNQLRKLEASSRWLREIQDSAQFKQLEYYPDVTLGDAIQAVGELLQEHYYCNDKPSCGMLRDACGGLRQRKN